MWPCWQKRADTHTHTSHTLSESELFAFYVIVEALANKWPIVLIILHPCLHEHTHAFRAFRAKSSL